LPFFEKESRLGTWNFSARQPLSNYSNSFFGSHYTIFSIISESVIVIGGSILSFSQYMALKNWESVEYRTILFPDCFMQRGFELKNGLSQIKAILLQSCREIA
jgi:hypothetical protein